MYKYVTTQKLYYNSDFGGSVLLEKFYFENPSHTDLNLYRCGIEDCAPGYLWGPGVRDHFIIHYIMSGKGVYNIGGKSYSLSSGDGFLIPPGTIISYKADMEDPWTYSWAGFHGIKAGHYLEKAGLTRDNPVFRYDRDDSLKQCLNDMIITANRRYGQGGEILMLSHLYRFMSILVDSLSPASNSPGTTLAEEYMKKAVEFTAKNYASGITVQGLADYVGIDRSYLYSLFRKHLNTSPQQFIITYRIKRACELLADPALSIADVARSVGYTDPLLFSKTFKKVMGRSPSSFKGNQAP
jgi:AraC-like DNA-binding protein